MTATVIVPTYDEGANAAALLQRMDQALLGRDVEVVFVDDGTDDLPEVAEQVQPSLRLPVRVIRRERPSGGLGGAVVEGIRSSTSDLIVVCDGDLQHPPELIPTLLDELADADLVVASRYTEGGDASGLSNVLRRLVSRAGGLLSKLAFPQRTKNCSDPMSGFFALRRAAVDVTTLQPIGFKILLEIIARSRPMRVREVPFVFGVRSAGVSHAGAVEGLRFVRQLLRLRVSASPTGGRAAGFMLVGASGVVVNLAALTALEAGGIGYLMAAFGAVQASILWNFAGAELFVWRRHRSADHLQRLLRFVAVGETDLGRLPFVLLLVSDIHMSSRLATLLTVGASFALRFVLADRVVYRRPLASAHPIAVGPEPMEQAA